MVIRFCGDLQIIPRDDIARFLMVGHKPISGQYILRYVPARAASITCLAEDTFHNPPPIVSVPNVRPRQFESPTRAQAQIEEHFERLATTFRQMANVEMNREEAKAYFAHVFEERNRAPLIEPLPVKEMENGLALCQQIFEHGGTNRLPSAAGTLWAAYNAVVEYVDHSHLAFDDWRHLREVWFSKLKASALNTALARPE